MPGHATLIWLQGGGQIFPPGRWLAGSADRAVRGRRVTGMRRRSQPLRTHRAGLMPAASAPNPELTVGGKGGKDRVIKIGHQAARNLDRYLRARSRHAQAWRTQLWLGAGNPEPLTPPTSTQMTARRGRQADVTAFPHRFRHHFSHTWLDCGGPEGDLMELNGWTLPQMLRRYGASARRARH